jgi:hypothetical protein
VDHVAAWVPAVLAAWAQAVLVVEPA